jgi:hypothetical protein
MLGFFALCGLAVAFYIGAFLATAGAPPVRPDHYWTAYFVREKQRLAAEETGPRILLFGTSSTFFGINAAQIQDVTGIPTFNMATHGGNGVAYTLSQARKMARKDDIVVILIDASVWIAAGAVQAHAVLSSHGVDNSFFMLSPLKEKVDILSHFRLSDAFAAYNRRNLPYERGQGGYWVYPVDTNGDIAVPEFTANRFAQVTDKLGTAGLTHLEDLYYYHERRTERNPYSIPNYVDGLLFGDAEFANVSQEKASLAIMTRDALTKIGAKVFFAIPPSIYTPDRRFRDDLVAIAGSETALLPIRPGLPLELMFDTDLHANRSGGELATSELLTALCGRIQTPCKADKLKEAELIAEGYRAIPPFPNMTGFGTYKRYEEGRESFVGRGSTGHAASFELFAPASCCYWLSINARVKDPARRVLFYVDHQRIANHRYGRGGFERVEIPLPTDGRMHRIEMEFLGVPETSVAAYLLREIKRINKRPSEPEFPTRP